MTELIVRLRKKELDYLKRNRNTVFAKPADGAYIGQLVRSRFLWALEALERDTVPTEPETTRDVDVTLIGPGLIDYVRSAHRSNPAEPEPGDPYADEPDEDPA